MEIYEWVQTARSVAQLTQTQLGEALGVTKGNVSAWERGRHEPSWSQMLKISQLTKAQLPLPPELKTIGKAWPFAIDRALFDSMPLSEREKIDDYVEYTVNKWHSTLSVKSKKAG